MKTRFLAVLLQAIIFASCGKETNADKASMQQQTMVRELESGNWHVVKFDMGGKRIEPFDHILFRFDKGNVINATDEHKSYTGSWRVYGGRKPEESMGITVTIHSGGTVNNLNGNWVVLEQSQTQLRLLSLDKDDWRYLILERMP